MPGINTLKYDEVTFKASHNSYERDETTHEQLVFYASNPSLCGCRGLEFDIWRHSNEKERFFTVSHANPEEGMPLAWYLGLLLSWHLNNPNHDVILITLDIKSSHGDSHTFPDEIDNYLREYFNGNIIFKPASLYSLTDLSLCQNVVRYGWPQLSELKNMFIFCLSGTEAWKSYYASYDKMNRLCFADKDIPDNDINVEPPTSGDIVFFNTHIWSDDYDTWKITMPKFKILNLIVRAYEVDGEALWNKAQGAGISILATNKVSGYSWAKVGNAAFVQRL